MGEIRLDPSQERAVRRSALAYAVGIAVGCGAVVASLILYAVVAGDPSGGPPAGQVNLTLSWHADGRIVASIEDPSWERAGQSRYAEALVPTLFPAGTAVDVTFPRDPKSEWTDIRAESREPVASIHSALHFDTQRLMAALPSVGLRRVDLEVDTPEVANRVIATRAPDSDDAGAVWWGGLSGDRPLRLTMTLHANGRPWAIGEVVVIVAGAVVMLMAVTWSWRAGRSRPERQARRILIGLTVASGVGLVASLVVVGHLDAVEVAYDVTDGWFAWLRWGPPLLWVAAGAWSFFAYVASDLRDSGRRKLLPPPPIVAPPVPA